MSRRAAAWVAWSLAGLCVAMFSGSVALFVLLRSPHVPGNLDASLTVGGLFFIVPYLAFPLVGALISSGRPENPIGWICLAVGLLWIFISTSDQYSDYGVARPGSVPSLMVVAGINNWLWVPAAGFLGTYLLMLFPDGRLPSRRWRPLAWPSGAVIVIASLGVMLDPGPLQNLEGTRNPFGLEGAPWVPAAASVALPLLPVCMIASGLSLVLRYGRSRGEVRQQIKWVAFSSSVVIVTYLLAMVASLVFPSEYWFAETQPLWLDLLERAALSSLTAVPIAVGFAVLRYRLYEIDILINRTLVYGSLTTMLAAIYFGGVIGSQDVFRALSGGESQLAIVASTLFIAALFNPLRGRVQAFVDRRFYRRKYDAAKTLAVYSTKLRNETDLDALDDGLVGVVRETMQPAHVSLWLRYLPDVGWRRGSQG